MHFRLWALRYTMRARVPLHGGANLLRGRFGAALLRADPQSYHRLFKPHSEQGPSGLADLPRPFAFRAVSIENGAADHNVSFDFHFFDARGPCDFRKVFEDMLNAETLSVDGGLVELPLEPNGPAHAVTVRFVSPTELKHEGRIVDRPEFDVLAARARDRVSALSSLYGYGPLDIDFRGFGERAASVAMTRCELHHVDAERTSKATGQTHSLGGFVGETSYTGDLGEFLPILRAAQWTGIGRQTAWGKGVIEVDATA